MEETKKQRGLVITKIRESTGIPNMTCENSALLLDKL
jgi:hypothetical protein